MNPRPLYILGIFLLCVGCGERKAERGHESASTSAVKAEGFERVWSGQTIPRHEWSEILEKLDDAARLRKGLAADDLKLLLERLAGGCPSGLSSGRWQHFFNSTLNALAASGYVSSSELTAPLLEVLENEDDKVLRLYSVQHLGLHHQFLPEPLRTEVGLRIHELASDPDEEVSGTATMVMGGWNGNLGEGAQTLSHEVLGKGVSRILADSTRPTDVRISAAHAAVDAGHAEALPAAREIAANPAESAILRKAAIHLIGQLGAESDKMLLVSCAKESGRLAQAADPALGTLDKRLSGHAPPRYIPLR